MRVIFLYTSSGAAGTGAFPDWNPKKESINQFVGEHGLPTEGYFYMLWKLLKLKVIDDLLVFIESNRGPGGKVISGIPCYVVPRIQYVEDFLQDDDIIFVRGGFKGWYDPFLLKMQAEKRWLVLYAANTGRQRWKLWDIVLSDLTTANSWDKRKRFFLLFNKPINPTLFFPMDVMRNYDVCIGASKIHDKKAQWRVIDALIEYKKAYGKTLKAILPGSMRYRGYETPLINTKIKEHGLNVEQPGFVNRNKLNEIYNRSKVYVYLGNSGENDRGPLEATSVGCPTILGGITRHAPFLRTCYRGIGISTDPTNPRVVAGEIHDMLVNHNEHLREHVASHFDKYNGFDTVVIPQMTRLFNLLRENPVPDIEAVKKEYLT